MRRSAPLPLLACLLSAAAPGLAANPGPTTFQPVYEIPSGCQTQTVTMQPDAAGRPFLYVATKEGGLRVYDVSAAPRLVRTIPTRALRSLHVMSLAQAGERLFLALGNHFSTNQSPGLAVVDISHPAGASLVDLWSEPALRGGAGAVASEGDLVYLGAMGNGIVTFTLSPAGKLQYQSRFVPSIQFPDRNPRPSLYNARGMAVRDGIVYLAYDAGGIRVIDATDPRSPREIGRYSNPALNRKPRAYNNLVLDGDLVYVTADYCGLEVLDVGDPSAIRRVSWWNPWQCQSNPFNWFVSPGHTNEIAYDEECKLLFLSAGKSDLEVLDIADPSRPKSAGRFPGRDNKMGTWGVARRDDRVYLSYICTLGIPFQSTWSGVKALRYDAPSCSAH